MKHLVTIPPLPRSRPAFFYNNMRCKRFSLSGDFGFSIFPVAGDNIKNSSLPVVSIAPTSIFFGRLCAMWRSRPLLPDSDLPSPSSRGCLAVLGWMPDFAASCDPFASELMLGARSCAKNRNGSLEPRERGRLLNMELQQLIQC